MRFTRFQMVFVSILFLLFFLFWGSQGFAQSAPAVVAIRVEGNQSISSQLILSAVSIGLKDPFDQEKIKTDIKSVFDLGYFSKVWIDTREYPEGVEVIFKVEENPLVKEVKIQGETQLSEDTIRKNMILAIGQVMNWKILQNDMERIKAFYSNSGFLLTAIDGANFSKDGVLNFIIHEGIVENVQFDGLTKTKDTVLRRELTFSLPFAFDFSKIKKSMRAIYNLGFFDDIGMKIEPGSDSNHVVVVVKVIEKLTGEAGVGVGYSSEYGWLGFIKYQENNFGGNGQKLELRYEFGSRTLYRLTFEEPWLLNSPTLLFLSVYDQIRNQDNRIDNVIIGKYEEERIGGQIGLGRKLNENWSARLVYKTENITLTPVEGITPDQGGITNSLTPMVIYDTRDDVFNPHAGWYGSLQVELAGRFLGGDNNYTKYVLDVRDFINIGKDTVLALRFLGGLADTELPEYEKFSVGGVMTLRGYDLSEFQGEQMLLFNAEYRWDIAKNLQLVFFGDAGYAWPLNDPIRFEDIKLGYGVGLRFETPIGPVRLDYGIGEAGAQTYFSIGHTF